jgi:mediator of replication checkpoint protein 1
MAVERSSPPPADEDAIYLGDDYLSPRSKVAKMLADIDNAPTPSPPSKLSTINMKAGPFMDESENEDEELSGRNEETTRPDTQRTSQSSAEEDEEEEGIVRRPQGRAARRMLNTAAPKPATQNDSDEDLYSATPLNPASIRRRREAFARAASGSPLGSSHREGTGLFVSPTKTAVDNSDEEDELPRPNKLAELVAQKRAERLARESEQQKAKKSRKSNGQHEVEHASSDLPEEVFEGSQEVPANPNVDRVLSDAARPTRKASKKAMIEMERETQRLARQQALAHQIKVKKKFSTNDLFARFNFRQPQQQPNQNEKNSSSMPSSDGIEPSPRRVEPLSTPPSSPPTPLDKQRLLVERGALAKMKPVRENTLASIATEEGDEDLPEMEDLVKSSQQVERINESTQTPAEKGLKIARWGKKSAPQTYRDEDSDDDLEVLQPLPKHLQIFDRIQPAKRQENHSNAIHTLRHLSHLGQVDAKPNRPTNVKPSIHPQVLEAQLRKKAREQAFQAQQERLAELKAKGIIIQTNEEKEREADEFENLLEKARNDAQTLRKAEKAARKKANGEEDMEASDDETEDEDYYDRSDDEDVAEGEEVANNDLIDDAADESVAEDDAEDIVEDIDDAATAGALELEATDDLGHEVEQEQEGPKHVRKPRKSHVIKDDEDDSSEDDELEADEQALSSAIVPGTADDDDQQDDPFAAFGFGAAKAEANAMSATQAFNATMQAPSQDTQDDSFDILRHVPPPSSFIAPPTLPTMESQAEADESQTQLATGHQSEESQGIQLNWETQAPETPGPTLVRKASDLSETPGWEPTQDPGLPSPWTGHRRGPLQRVPTLVSAAEDDHETQATVELRVSESPAPKVTSKRGRLQQRKRLAADESDDDEIEPVVRTQKDAFKEMKRQRMNDLNANDRNEAEAEMKRMMDDQADESEDEYAGLGGDDTEMIAPETAEDQDMFDESHIDVDERAIAAHHAARERVAEEEATKKLYKDITTGALRRRQRDAWDFDEEEDDYLARRRQMRLREETRKRKLLLQDENVKDWAEKGKHSKGKDAFLKAIADDDEDVQDTADQSTQQTQPEVDGVPLQEISGNKRPADEDEGATQERPPAKQRRTKEADVAFSRPTSIDQVRESLSFLLDEPGQITVGPLALDEDSDLEIEGEPVEEDSFRHNSDDDEVAAEESRQNDGGFAPNPKSVDDKALMPPPARLPAPQRRTAAKAAIVDRLSLKRGSSSSTSADSRSAWSTGGSSSSVQAPSLLRRATTNVSSGANDRGVTTGSGGNDRGVTVGGGARVGSNKKSSLAYQARAEERRTIVEASARRRAENTAKIAELRRANSSSMARIGFAGSGFE